MTRKLNRTGSFMFCAALALTCAVPCFAEEGPIPGPAQEARQKLFDRIQLARAQGIGISGYLQAFKALEEQVKAGDSPDKISTRVDSINKAVNEQIERAKILKSQKPIPPQGSQLTGSAPVAKPAAPATQPAAAGAAGAAAGPGGQGGSDIMSKLKDKFGDRIPDSVKERLLNDPSILEKIKEKARGQN